MVLTSVINVVTSPVKGLNSMIEKESLKREGVSSETAKESDLGGNRNIFEATPTVQAPLFLNQPEDTSDATKTNAIFTTETENFTKPKISNPNSIASKYKYQRIKSTNSHLQSDPKPVLTHASGNSVQVTAKSDILKPLLICGCIAIVFILTVFVIFKAFERRRQYIKSFNKTSICCKPNMDIPAVEQPLEQPKSNSSSTILSIDAYSSFEINSLYN